VSVKALDKDVALWDPACLYEPVSGVKSIIPWPASFSSSLRLADRGDGDGCSEGDDGEIALDGCEGVSEGEALDMWALSGMLVSEALRISLPGPMPFFCLNFSSQEWLLVLTGLSPAVKCAAKYWARSLISASVIGWPDFWALRAQLARAFSISGSLPFARRTGELLRSSGNRYFSFWRSTFDTVLAIC